MHKTNTGDAVELKNADLSFIEMSGFYKTEEKIDRNR